MKNSQALFKLADKFQRKYAQSQDLKTILQNAASYGESSANGIMNFISKIKEQKAYLGLRITISSGFTGASVTVADPATDPPQLAGSFVNLPAQIKKYLERNLKGFPQITEGVHDVAWDFREPGGEGIAQNPNW